MTGGIATKTLAEVYLSQGNPRKALEIYQEILRREPSNREVRKAVEDLERKVARNHSAQDMGSSSPLSRSEKIRILERWQENIRIVRNRRTKGNPVA